MRPRSRAVAGQRRDRRGLIFAAILAVTLPTTGCASLFSSGPLAPNGLPRKEDALRRRLAAGDYGEALSALEPGGEIDPGDDLLALMYRGLVAHYGGRYEESSASLEQAEREAEDRYTKSLSRALLSLITSDRVLKYDPKPTERLLLHYYGALNYLRVGDMDEAAVEARRLTHLLDLFEEKPVGAEEGAVRGLMRYFAGAVFEASGEANDAEVAYRLARARGIRTVSAPPDAGADESIAGTGEVLVLVEKGFVAHRIEESLNIVLWPHELEVFQSGPEPLRLTTSTCVVEYALGDPAARPVVPAADVPAALRASVKRSRRPRGRERCLPWPPRQEVVGEEKDETHSAEETSSGGHAKSAEAEERRTRPYLLRIALPAYRRSGELHAPVHVVLDEGEPAPIAWSANLSDAVIAEFEAGAVPLLIKTLARTAVKYAVARKLEDEAREEDKTLGDIVGALADAGSALLERADTRAWHLLPDEIGVTRLRLPAGEHTLALRVGRVGTGSERRIALGPVEVRPGAVRIVSARVWR
ncbi:MAG: hypothetical protein ACE5JR_00855 [Gemmatimonadota bacterium]